MGEMAAGASRAASPLAALIGDNPPSVGATKAPGGNRGIECTTDSAVTPDRRCDGRQAMWWKMGERVAGADRAASPLVSARGLHDSAC